MICHKRHRTLKDDIEQLKKDANLQGTKKRKGRFLIKFVFSLIFLAMSYILGVLYEAAIMMLLIYLFRCLLARHRFRKGKSHDKTVLKYERQVVDTAEKILLFYLILLGLLFTFYGCINYVLHVRFLAFSLKEWFKGSFFIFLLFETIVLHFYRKIEREV